LTAVLTLPALIALIPLRRFSMARSGAKAAFEGERKARVLTVLTDRRLLVFCGCAMLFTFANAPLLMLISGTLTAKGSNPSLLIGACIVLPQVIVALASPAVARFADRRGRRLVLIVGFLMLPIRALVFSTTANPALVIGVQVLDGIAGAGFGILVPLIVSDVAARSGHFNLSLGAVGFAIGIGSTVSTSAAGWVADHFGIRSAFYFLAVVGLSAVLLALFAMPETRPAAGDADAASTAPRRPRLPRGGSP
jgi:MFS family permease